MLFPPQGRLAAILIRFMKAEALRTLFFPSSPLHPHGRTLNRWTNLPASVRRNIPPLFFAHNEITGGHTCKSRSCLSVEGGLHPAVYFVLTPHAEVNLLNLTHTTQEMGTGDEAVIFLFGVDKAVFCG
jgi:hypothetical protein